MWHRCPCNFNKADHRHRGWVAKSAMWSLTSPMFEEGGSLFLWLLGFFSNTLLSLSLLDQHSVWNLWSHLIFSGTRKFMATQRQCGFLWKMLTVKSSYIMSIFCWRANLHQMNTRWSFLFLCLSLYHHSTSSKSCQTNGLVRVKKQIFWYYVLKNIRI